MTDLSPSRRAHLRKNAQIYGDEEVVEILDALEAVVTERDELRDVLVNRIFAEKSELAPALPSEPPEPEKS